MSSVERRLAALYREILGVSAVRSDSDFFELGGHSLLAARLVQAVRRGFGVRMTIAELYRHPRLGACAGLIAAREAVAAALPDCVVPIQVGGDWPPFFCAAPAGGSPLCYRALARQLGAGQVFLGLQTPGLTGARPLLRRVEDIAATYVAAVRQLQPVGPYRIGGWSFGAAVAWEMAVQLREQGQNVDLLALLEWGIGPGKPRGRPTGRFGMVMRGVLVALMCVRFVGQMRRPRSYRQVRELAQWVGVGLPESWAFFGEVPWLARLRIARRILADARRSGRVFVANMVAATRYQPRRLTERCVVFRAGAGHGGGDDALVARLRALSDGALEVVDVAGTHMSVMMDETHICGLAAALGQRLSPPTNPPALFGRAV